MDIDTETLIAGLLCLGYVLYGPLVKGGFWKQNWTNKGGKWVSAAEGPIFFHINDHSIPDAWYCVNS